MSSTSLNRMIQYHKYEKLKAVIYDDGNCVTSYTYADINEKANQIQDFVLQLCREKEVIGICAADNPNVIPAILGILDSGCAFYNFDTDGLKFVSNVLTRIGIQTLMIHSTKLQAVRYLLDKHDGEVLKDQKLSSLDLIVVQLNSISSKSCDHDIAYCITTSGTTGVPKIVQVPHKCIASNIIHIKQIYKMSSKDVVLHCSPLTFDPSIVEIFMTLTSGACLVMVPQKLKQSPQSMLEVIKRCHVSLIQATPSFISRMNSTHLRSFILGPRSQLRILSFGGEEFPPITTLNTWRSPDNTTTFINLYGTTEVSCWATYYVLTPQDLVDNTKRVPLGRPLLNTVISIKDVKGNEVHRGQGQLYIGGRDRVCNVDPDDCPSSDNNCLRSTGDIVEVEDDGSIIFMGRKDSQFKRNGKRIDLRQIEKILSENENLHWSKAVYYKNQLTLFYKRKEDYKCKDISSVIGTMVREELPSHYWIDRIKEIDVIPITRHGKCDVSSLLAMTCDAMMTTVDGNADLPMQIRHLWMEILNIDSLEPSANFFDLGGNSFLAVQFFERMESYMEVKLPNLIETLFNKDFQAVEQYIIKRYFSISKEFDNSDEDRKTVKMARQSVKDTDEKLNEKRRRIDNDLIVYQTNETKDLFHEAISSTERSKLFGIYPVQRSKCVNSGIRNIYDGIKKDSTGTCDRNEDIPSIHSTKLHLELAWKYSTGKCVDASPLVVRLSCGYYAVFIGSHSHRFLCIVVETGELLWEITLGGRVESSACMSSCGHFIIVGCYDGCIYSLSIETGEIIWKFQTGGEVKSSPSVDPVTSLVIIGSHDKHLYALNIQTRGCVWRTFLGGGSVFSSPCISQTPHVIIASTLTGLIVQIPISGEILWKYDAGKPIFSSPALTSLGPCLGCVDGNLYQLDFLGKLIWKFSSNSPIFSSPSILVRTKHNLHCDTISPETSTDDFKASSELDNEKNELTTQDFKILIGSHDYHMYCLNSDGSLSWKVATDSFVYSSAFVFSLSLSVPLEFKVQAFKLEKQTDLESPECVSKVTNQGKLLNSQIVCKKSSVGCQCCVFASSMGTLYIVDMEEGYTLCTHTLPGEVFSSPVVLGNQLLIGCRDDFVYCFNILKSILK